MYSHFCDYSMLPCIVYILSAVCVQLQQCEFTQYVCTQVWFPVHMANNAILGSPSRPHASALNLKMGNRKLIWSGLIIQEHRPRSITLNCRELPILNICSTVVLIQIKGCRYSSLNSLLHGENHILPVYIATRCFPYICYP